MKFDSNIPWSRMSKKKSQLVAFLKSVSVVAINLAIGVSIIWFALETREESKNNKTWANKKFHLLGKEVKVLKKNNSELLAERNELDKELAVIRVRMDFLGSEMQMKDARIEELEKREKFLIARIEELERQLNS